MTDIFAFDYNGTLTTEAGLDLYKSKAKDPRTQVGILTSNLIFNASRFCKRQDIEPDFIRRGLFKSPELLYISRFTSGKTVYVGNELRDELASQIAGWEYIPVESL